MGVSLAIRAKCLKGAKMKKYYGPFTLTIDEDNQVVTVELKRGIKPWRLLDGELTRLRAYVLKVAEGYGWKVLEY